MYLFHIFRSFLPVHNPIGFGASDFVEFALALLLLALVFARAWLAPLVPNLTRRAVWGMLMLFATVGALRLALLGMHPVPTASGADDFSYLLLGDTFAHLRLANPTHLMHRFFETTFVLQQPTYSSIYPIAPGLVLAAAQVIFGIPWAGVLLSLAAFSALCYWMLRGWTSPGWALVGGILAACQFGPLNNWANTYWGGAVSAVAGSLVFGALPRLRDRFRTRDALLLGLGLGIQTLSRPYESLFLDVAVVLFFVPLALSRKNWPAIGRIAVPAALALLPAAALLLAHNRAVTGSWTTLPYQLSRYQYGIPTTFTFQDNPVPHAQLTPAQQLYYDGQSAVHDGPDSIAKYFERLASRAGFYRFFFYAPLCLAGLFFLPMLREYRYAWIAITLALFALGTNFYSYFFPHYIAALTCLFVLVPILGLQRIAAIRISCFPSGQLAARWIVFLCIAQFLFWFAVNAQPNEQILRAMSQYETGDNINFGDPQGRIAVNHTLAAAPGQQLVFVRYFSSHRYDEWIHNAADIDRARVVWALELSPADNAELRSYYPDRTVWLLEPDALPPRLVPYPAKSNSPFLNVQ